MPAETHRRGSEIEMEDVRALLEVLLYDAATEQVGNGTLASRGVGADELYDLWDAVCEEFGERTLGPEIDPAELNPCMTLEEAATAMVRLLVAEGDHGD